MSEEELTAGMAERGIVSHNYLSNLNKMTDEEITAMLNQEPGRTFMDEKRAEHPEVTDRQWAIGMREHGISEYRKREGMEHDEDFLLKLAPRQAAIELGWNRVRRMFQVYYFRNRDAFESFPLNPDDYPDSIPEDHYFEDYCRDRLQCLSGRYGPDQLRLAFAARCALRLVREPNSDFYDD